MFAKDRILSTSASVLKDLELSLSDDLLIVNEWLTLNKPTLNGIETDRTIVSTDAVEKSEVSANIQISNVRINMIRKSKSLDFIQGQDLN